MKLRLCFATGLSLAMFVWTISFQFFLSGEQELIEDEDLPASEAFLVHGGLVDDSDLIHIAIPISHENLEDALYLIKSIIMNAAHPHLIKLHVIVPPLEALDLAKCLRGWRESSESISQLQHVSLVPLHLRMMNSLQLRLIAGFLGPTKTHPFSYAKLYLADILPNISRVIYLDTDTLVIGDISELWSKPLYVNDLALCVPHSDLKKKKGFVTGTLPSWLSRVSFFQAGVFVANLNSWRRENVTGLLERWVRRNLREKLFRGVVQGPMNAVIGSRYRPLPYTWNFKVTLCTQVTLTNNTSKRTATSPKILRIDDPLASALSNYSLHSTTNSSLNSNSNFTFPPPLHLNCPDTDIKPGISLGLKRPGTEIVFTTWTELRQKYNPWPAGLSQEQLCPIQAKDSLTYPESLRQVVSQSFVESWLAEFEQDRIRIDPSDYGGLTPGADGRIHIAMAFSSEHSRGAYALCRSLRAHAGHKEQLWFHMVVPAGDEVVVDRCAKFYCGPNTNLTPFNASLLQNLNETATRKWRPDLLHPMNLARFFLAELFPHLSRVIFMDTDMICVTDIATLWKIALDVREWGACVPDENLQDHILLESAYPKLDFALFNAGMMMINLNAWRAHRVGKQCMLLLKHNSDRPIFKGVTQGPLNFVLGKNYKMLDKSWNVRFWAKKNITMSDVYKKAKILHWAGKVKPYQGSMGHYVRGYDIWRNYEVRDNFCAVGAGTHPKPLLVDVR